MKMKRLRDRVILTFVALLFLPLPLLAVGPGFNPYVDDGCDVPLDGGLSFLAAAGAGLVIKKVADGYKKKKSSVS